VRVSHRHQTSKEKAAARRHARLCLHVFQYVQSACKQTMAINTQREIAKRRSSQARESRTDRPAFCVPNEYVFPRSLLSTRRFRSHVRPSASNRNSDIRVDHRGVSEHDSPFVEAEQATNHGCALVRTSIPATTNQQQRHRRRFPSLLPSIYSRSTINAISRTAR